MKSKLYVLVIILLILVGCATEKSIWEKVKKENTKDAPFRRALTGYNAFVAGLIELTAELFGPGIYKTAITDDHDLIQEAAVHIAGRKEN